MKNFIFKSSLIFLFIFSGCGYKQQNIQKADVAYLKFQAPSTKGYKVMVNDNIAFSLTDEEKDKSYKIQSGKNHLRVYKNDTLVLDKKIYLSNESTKLINLP